MRNGCEPNSAFLSLLSVKNEANSAMSGDRRQEELGVAAEIRIGCYLCRRGRLLSALDALHSRGGKCPSVQHVIGSGMRPGIVQSGGLSDIGGMRAAYLPRGSRTRATSQGTACYFVSRSSETRAIKFC